VSQILSRFAEICRREPTRPILHLPAVAAAWSAGDVWDAHRRYADRLASIGLGPGQLVLSAAGNSPASVALLLACLAADVPIMPVDAGATMPEILAFADRFAAAAMIVPAALDVQPRVGRLPTVDLDPGLRLTRLHHRDPRGYPGAAILKLTSGSTGPVKATLTTEAQMVADGDHIVAAMGIDASDTQIASIPISHAYGLGSLMMPLLMLGTACVLRDSFVPHQLPADARRFGARIFPGVPFMFEYFLANPPAGGWPPTLQRLMSAGAPLAPATVRAFHDRYGVKIPMRPFFTATSLLLYYMAFVFMGKGIRELQEGNVLPITVIRGLPNVPSMGIFPSVETLTAQLLLVILLVFAVAKTFWPRAQDPTP